MNVKIPGFRAEFKIVGIDKLDGILSPDRALVRSIEEHGLIQPVVVAARRGRRYELLAGRRRSGAFRELGYAEIPAIVHRGVDALRLIEIGLSENLARRANPLNEAEMVRVWQSFEEALDAQAIQAHLGLYRRDVNRLAGFLNLSERLFQAMMDGEIGPSTARTLARLEHDEQDRFLEIEGKKTLAAAREYVRACVLQGELDFLSDSLPAMTLKTTEGGE